MAYKITKLETQIRRIVANFILKKIDILSQNISITRVAISPDKSQIQIFWTTADSRRTIIKKLSEALRKHEHAIRRKIFTEVKSIAPKSVTFKFDDTPHVLSEIARAEKILEKLSRDEKNSIS
ncbi:MAG: ribosome-binding factor A [Deltaproteobacteria bacterium]|nr:ribosome-binding factor A [Deltaproteobacteria bacterium]MCX7952991.1 ribosome-binding factor A [Deltaproteobacteria bacterium]